MPSGIYKHKTCLEETKKKISEALKGIKKKPFSKKHKRKLSLAHIGKYLSEETKLKISEAKKGRYFTEEHRRKLSEVQKSIPMERHNRWKGGLTTDNGYTQFKPPKGCRFSPMKDKHGYIRLHRLIMAEYLQRLLEPEEIVHHINENITDNRIENLKILKNKSEHTDLHHKLAQIQKTIRG